MMPKKQPQLAKLTRPRLHRAVERPRLFAILDEAREHKPAICVVGPPGAGKTTLVASWLDARDINGIWYQVDSGDVDLATFFYYLGESAKQFQRKGQRPLPLLTPEYLQDIEGFSRRFFRELFARLPEGATLVLDNYQEVGPEQHFHHLVAQAVDEVPPGMNLIAISRRDPPDCYARIMANENAAFVDWDTLKLTLDEAQSIAAHRGAIAGVDIGQMHEQCQGWAAGLTLLLEGSRRNSGGAAEFPSGRNAIFEYFAAQIFEKVPESIQEFLVITAFLPQVPVSIAGELTGNADAAAILEDLYRRHLFTHRRPAIETVYWYHALFRDFLKTRALRVLGKDGCRNAIGRAAALLESNLAFDDAIQLHTEAGAWPAIARLAEGRAADLLAKGRGQTLRDWISILPGEYLAANPRLRFWLGVSLISIDQIRARENLETAFEAFRIRNDLVGQLETTSRIISTYYFEWSSFEPLDRWIEVLEELIAGTSGYPSPETEFDAYSSMLLAALYRKPGHPLLPRAAERVMQFLGATIDLNRRVTGAIYLLSYAVLARDNHAGARALAFVQPLLDHSELSPLNQVWVHARMGYFLYQVGDYEAACGELTKAEATVERYGLKGLRSAGRLIDSYWCSVLVGMRNFDLFRERYQKIVAFADPDRPMDRFHLHDPYLYLESATGNLGQLEIHARGAIEAANAAGMPYIQAMSRIFLCEALAELGRYAELATVLDEARSIIQGTCHKYYEAELDFVEAYSWFSRDDDQQGVACLRRGLAEAGRRKEPLHLLRHNHRVLGRLAVIALEQGLEREYISDLVRRFRVSPPDAHVASWPWPVKVHVLGTFELRVNEELVTFSGKAPKKPLALLKALIANGGRNVPEERLIDALWPDEEADAARKSLDITVLRLRKLLGANESVLVANELVSLDSRLCWTDVWAFEHGMEQFESGTRDLGDAASVLGLYRGSFLPTDVDVPWTAKARERLRGKFVRLVEVVALEEENARRWEQAIHSYLRGLEADDLVEPFYQGLMRCYRSLGRHAEAMGTYRKLRHLLSVVLGISPSEASQALAMALQRDNPAQFENS